MFRIETITNPRIDVGYETHEPRMKNDALKIAG